MVDSLLTRIQENHFDSKKAVRPRTYWKIYNDGHGLKMELTHIPVACALPIQLLSTRGDSSRLQEQVFEALSPLACDMLGLDFVDFALLPEVQQKEALLAVAYNYGNVTSDGLGKLCRILGLDNWQAPDRTASSLKRTKKKFVDYALNNPFEYFVTLTVAPRDDLDRMNLTEVKKVVALAVQHLNRKFSCKLSYIFIPEPHKSGAWHLHGLLGGVPDEALTAFSRSRHNSPYIRSKVAHGEPIFKCQFFEDKLGWNTLEPIENKDAVVRYCTKYITKELLNARVAKNTRLLIASQGLEKPAHGECPEKLQRVLDEWFDSCKPAFTARRNWRAIEACSDAKEKELLLADTSSISYFKYSLVGAELDSFLFFCSSHGITLEDFLQIPRLQDP